jgi:sulfur-carrier protein
MAIKIRIPPGMRPLTDNRSLVEAPGASVHEVIASLETTFPAMQGRLRDPQGKQRRFINIYVNGVDIRSLQHHGTPLREHDEVDIVAAVAGG